MLKSGRAYTIEQLSKNHPHWKGVQDAISRRTKPGTSRLQLAELHEVRWVQKPFSWSYRDFKKGRRWFFHGTRTASIARILNEGFKIKKARTGRMLGDGVYATYHTNKGKSYGPDGYVVSVMIYAPKTYVVGPGQSIAFKDLAKLCKTRQAIEVRTGAVVGGYTMQNHEICVYDTRHIIPRFVLKLG